MPRDHSNKISGWMILLLLFSAALIYGIFFMGTPISQETMADRRHRDIYLLLTGILGMAGALICGRFSAVRRIEDRVVIGASLALPCYVLFTLLPLPSMLVGILSPARAELVHALEPLYGHVSFTSLSIAPSATFSHLLLAASYCVLLLAAREFSIRSGANIWLVAAPVVLAASLESIMGLFQFMAPGQVQARGTYVIRNHLAGLLEMALPLAAMYTASVFAKREFLKGAIAAVVSALLLTGAFCTLSRGGFFAIVISALLIAAVAIGRDLPVRRRLLVISLIGFATVIILFFVTPVSLIARLSEHTSEGRLTVWGEALGIVREYPLTGTGMGGFESAFLKFKAAEGLFVVDYAHNDYLQLLIELGAVGFLIGAALVIAVMTRCIRRANSNSDARWVGLACLGSLTAMLFHSLVDFNLYVAANAAVVAWICGMAAGLQRSSPRLMGGGRVTRRENLFSE